MAPLKFASCGVYRIRYSEVIVPIDLCKARAVNPYHLCSIRDRRTVTMEFVRSGYPQVVDQERSVVRTNG